MRIRIRVTFSSHKNHVLVAYLVLVRSSGYVTVSATDAAATDMMYFLATVSLSERITRSFEMSSSACSACFTLEEEAADSAVVADTSFKRKIACC